MDKALRIDPLAIYHWTLKHAWAEDDLVIVYKLLLTMVVIAWIAEQNRTMRIALVAGGIGVFILYGIFPAIGPAYFDWSRGVASAVEPTNCMPSMHMAWALLIAVNARGRALKVVLWSFAAMTGVATIGLGQHYVVDLVAAVPYAAASQAVALRFPKWAARRNPWRIESSQNELLPAGGDSGPQGCSTRETSSPSNSL
jgi:membrane-associated phospholipid phosphatase